jgi:hypothetical protein
VDPGEQRVRFAELGPHRQRLVGVGARRFEVDAMEAGERAKVEEQGGIGGALGAPQGIERAVGISFLDRHRGVEDQQIGVARARPSRSLVAVLA